MRSFHPASEVIFTRFIEIIIASLVQKSHLSVGRSARGHRAVLIFIFFYFSMTVSCVFLFSRADRKQDCSGQKKTHKKLDTVQINDHLLGELITEATPGSTNHSAAGTRQEVALKLCFYFVLFLFVFLSKTTGHALIIQLFLGSLPQSGCCCSHFYFTCRVSR